MADKELSTGEFMVRTEFNPSKSGHVEMIKQEFASLINLIESLPENEDWTVRQKSSFARLKSRSFTAIEDAAMIAVKAATV